MMKKIMLHNLFLCYSEVGEKKKDGNSIQMEAKGFGKNGEGKKLKEGKGSLNMVDREFVSKVARFLLGIILK